MRAFSVTKKTNDQTNSCKLETKLVRNVRQKRPEVVGCKIKTISKLIVEVLPTKPSKWTEKMLFWKKGKHHN